MTAQLPTADTGVERPSPAVYTVKQPAETLDSGRRFVVLDDACSRRQKQ
mgnify:CR=1 FL=1